MADYKVAVMPRSGAIRELLVDSTDAHCATYVKVTTKEAAQDLVERQGELWWLNPLCGGKDALLEPMFVPTPGGVG